MKATFLVIDAVVDKWQSAKLGPQILHVIVVLDQSAPPLRNTMDYVLTEDEREKYQDGKGLVGKKVELGLKDMQQNFSGRIRCYGLVEKVL